MLLKVLLLCHLDMLEVKWLQCLLNLPITSCLAESLRKGMRVRNQSEMSFAVSRGLFLLNQAADVNIIFSTPKPEGMQGMSVWI